MKKILLLTTVLALSLSARAGLVTDAQWNGGTNNIAAASTNNMRASASTLSFNNAKDPTFQLTYATSAANTATNILRLDNSLDNANWNTNAATITLTNQSATGTNQVFTFTVNNNTPCVSPNAPFWRLGQFEETNATVYYTNVNFKGFGKTGL